jgi:hypothetical protein
MYDFHGSERGDGRQRCMPSWRRNNKIENIDMSGSGKMYQVFDAQACNVKVFVINPR